MPTNEHVLEIGSLHPVRPTVLIRTAAEPDGNVHELRTYLELSPSELAEIVSMAEKADKLGSKESEELSPKEIRQLERWLNRILEIAFHPSTPITADENAELTIDQRASIVEAFTAHCLVTTGDKQEPKRTPARKRAARTGAR